MKKITPLLFMFLCLSLSAQWSNGVFPSQVYTSPDDDSSNNVYTGSIDYSFSSQAEVDALSFMAIRIRPITAPFTKDPAVDNTDFGILTDFKNYVAANNLTGTYTWNLDMPNDADLPSTADRQALPGADSGWGYDTRFQTNGFQTGFVTLEVLESSVLSNNDFNKSKLSAYYNSNLDAIIVDNSIVGKYSVYNLLGQSVQNGEISREISVNTLKSGLYILTTESGLLKFAK